MKQKGLGSLPYDVSSFFGTPRILVQGDLEQVIGRRVYPEDPSADYLGVAMEAKILTEILTVTDSDPPCDPVRRVFYIAVA